MSPVLAVRDENPIDGGTYEKDLSMFFYFPVLVL